MIVVSDTSPLSNLAIVGRLSLLREIYNTVIIDQNIIQLFLDFQHIALL